MSEEDGRETDSKKLVEKPEKSERSDNLFGPEHSTELAKTLATLQDRYSKMGLLYPEIAPINTVGAQKSNETDAQLARWTGKVAAQTAKMSVLESQIHELQKTIEATSSSASDAKASFDQEIAAAKRTLHEHTRLTAPVDLWHEKREEHVEAQEKHQKNFQWSLVVIGVLALAILLVAVFSPNLIDQLLTPVGCDPLQPETCRGVSSRSILGGATILTFFTVLLWFTRLQMKLYLAERHLALDARERIAFSRSYVGLLAEGDTSEEAKQQRSLVYAALFRPSSDGAIKEEGGLDPAISAAISKLLTR